MKTLLVALVALVSLSSLAPLAHADRASDLQRVRALADRKIAGSDVKKEISVYQNKDGNPCAEPGVTYIVKVSVRHAVLQDPDGPATPRPFELVNTYSISRQGLLAGQDLDDSLCQE